MKLNLVPARTGLTWVKLGIRTFFKQPLALSGLFFMFMALLSVASLLPFVGSVLALALLPAATLGLMAATLESTRGKFPMPSILISAFRAGQQRKRAMLVLGGLYAAGFLGMMGVTALIDGGQFARLYLLGGKITEEMVLQGDFQAAMWAAMLLYLPLSLLFWHAPALVHWHGVSPVKSLFFSFMACVRNLRAFMVYVALWFGFFVGVAALSMLVASLLGDPSLLMAILLPAGLMVAAMFFTSMVYSVRDCFQIAPSTPAPSE